MAALPFRLSAGGVIKVLVILTWLGMTAALFGRLSAAPELIIQPEDRTFNQESWMSVFFGGQKVGYTYQAISQAGAGGYSVDQNTYMRLNLMGTVQVLRTVLSAQLDDVWGLERFHFFMSSGPVQYKLSGRMEGRDLVLSSMTGGKKMENRIQLDQTPRLAAGLMPYLGGQKMEEGDRYEVPIFDPSTLSTKPVTVTVEGRESLRIDEETVETFRIRQDYHGVTAYAWVDDQGRVIKEDGLLGLSMVRTTEERATEGIAGRAELIDVLEATSAPAGRSIESPREAVYLRASLEGVDLAGLDLGGGRQILDGDVVVVRTEDLTRPPAQPVRLTSSELEAYLGQTNFIQAYDPKIQRLADRLTVGIDDRLTRTRRITEWVYDNLEKRPTMSVPSAVEVLDSRVGDCNEHSVLAAALLRAAGVPARMAVGVLYYGGRFYYHAWVEVFLDQWVAVDPLLNQIPADATHIRFLFGGLARQSEMIRIIGRLKVDVLEAQ
jgi:hypothetical protein